MARYPEWNLHNDVRVNCKDCTAECCKHVALAIDAPSSKEDYEQILSWVLHENVVVYQDNDKDWIVEFKTRCGKLDGNRCMAFASNAQPLTCREYSVKNCVMNAPGDYWTVYFWSSEDVRAYARKKGFSLKGVCRACKNECCNHVHVPIDPPESWRAFDDIKWYIAHANVKVYKDGDGWYVEFRSPMRERCERCDFDACRYDNAEHEISFTRWEEVEEYLAQHKVSPTAKERLKLTGY